MIFQVVPDYLHLPVASFGKLLQPVVVPCLELLLLQLG